MDSIKTIVINKNRGWRGLAEVKCQDESGKVVTSMLFSFSPKVWEDLLAGYIVIPYEATYLVLQFNNIDKLPKPTQQRSVLIKNFTADVVHLTAYPNDSWFTPARENKHLEYISNFKRNRNNHTQSDWNCIGIRVTPF